MMLTGSCYCGACRFELQRQPKIMVHCHCSICRRIQGAAFGSYAQLPFKYFVWAESSAAPRSFPSSPDLMRYFCGICGTHLMHCPSQAPSWAAVSLACVHEPLQTAPLAHVFTGSKTEWLQLPDDGLPRFNTLPEEPTS